ncbi:MAG: OsmC family protein [Bryobacterales bacterium]|nr:OsmC family protein [Bryobacterales bacterium]
MEAQIEYESGVQFAVDIRGHRLVCDQPTNAGGQDAGITPPEFLLASLGTCAGYYAVEYLKTRSLPVEGVRISVRAEKALNPGRLSRFHIDVEVDGLTDDRHREGVLRAVKRCLIHNTLLHPPEIEIGIHTPVTM